MSRFASANDDLEYYVALESTSNYGIILEQKQFLWVERYRPQTIDECVLPEDLKDTFKDMIQSGEAKTLCSPALLALVKPQLHERSATS